LANFGDFAAWDRRLGLASDPGNDRKSHLNIFPVFTGTYFRVLLEHISAGRFLHAYTVFYLGRKLRPVFNNMVYPQG
jgi:hypothetical protein